MNIPFLKKVTENHVAVLVTFVLLFLLVLLKFQENNAFKKITDSTNQSLITSVEYSK